MLRFDTIRNWLLPHRRGRRNILPTTLYSRLGAESLEPRWLPSAYPYVAGDADRTWMKQLETGSGDLLVPASGVVIDRKVVVTKATRIVGQGHAIHLIGNGQIVALMSQPQATLEVQGAKIDWYRDSLSLPAQVSAFHVLNGKFVFANNSAVSYVLPRTALAPPWYDEGPGNWLLRTGGPTTNVLSLTIEDNTFQSVRSYSTGLLVMGGKTKVAGVHIERNTATNFHGTLYVSQVVGASISDNHLFRNSLGNLVVNGSQKSVVARNRIELSGNGTTGDGMTLQNLSGDVFRQNTIVNGSCYGIWMLLNVSNTTFSDNSILGGITSGVYIANSSHAGVFSNLQFVDNTITGNMAWAVEAVRVRGLTLTGNVFGGNQTDGGGRQHRFVQVTGLSASGNWQIPKSASAASSGAVAYEFDGADASLLSTASRLDAVAAARPALPATSAAANATWLKELETGSGIIHLPETGITIDRVVVLRQIRQIVGNRATLRFVGAGRLIVAMTKPTDPLVLMGADVRWDRTSDADVRQPIYLQRGRLIVAKNRFDVDSIPTTGGPSWLFTLGGTAATRTSAVFTANQALSRRVGTVGLVCSPTVDGLDRFEFVDNQAQAFHGGVQLRGSADLRITRNVFRRTSLNNIDIANSTGGEITDNRLLFAGDVQAADGIVVADSTNISIEANLLFDTLRSGIVIRRTRSSTVAENIVIRSRRNGIEIEAATTAPATGLVVIGNTLVNNLGYGLLARQTSSLVVTKNLFQENAMGKSAQYVVEGVGAKISGNLRDVSQTSDDVRRPKSLGTNVFAYDLAAMGSG